MAEERRADEQTTAQEPHRSVQGEGGVGRVEGRKAAAGVSGARRRVNRRAAVVFTDPPYNVVIDGHASGNGRIHHAEFAMASGEMSEAEFTEFLATALSHLADWSTDGSVHFVAMDWRHMPELLAAGKRVYDSLLNLWSGIRTMAGWDHFIARNMN